MVGTGFDTKGMVGNLWVNFGRIMPAYSALD